MWLPVCQRIVSANILNQCFESWNPGFWRRDRCADSRSTKNIVLNFADTYSCRNFNNTLFWFLAAFFSSSTKDFFFSSHKKLLSSSKCLKRVCLDKCAKSWSKFLNASSEFQYRSWFRWEPRRSAKDLRCNYCATRHRDCSFYLWNAN